MASISEIISSVPQPVQWALAGVGAYVVASRVLSYTWLLLELFVLSGTNVRGTLAAKSVGVLLTSEFCSSVNMVPRARGPSSPAPPTVSARSMRSSSLPRASTSSSCPAPSPSLTP